MADKEPFKPGLSRNQGLVKQLSEFQRNPKSLVFVSLAESYRLEGLPHQALEILEEGLAYHPSLTSAVLAKARCLFDLRRYAEALKECQEAIQYNPANIKAHKLESEIYIRLGQRRAAIRALSKVVSLFPQDVEAVRALEELENLENRQNVPIQQITRASVDTPPTTGKIEEFQVGSLSQSLAALQPSIPEQISKESIVLEQKGNSVPTSSSVAAPTVAPSETKAHSPAPAAPVESSVVSEEDEQEPTFATRTIAELYLRQGLKPKALKVLKKIVKEDPSNGWARETLQELESNGIVLQTPEKLPPKTNSLEKKAKALEKLLARVRLMKRIGAEA